MTQMNPGDFEPCPIGLAAGHLSQWRGRAGTAQEGLTIGGSVGQTLEELCAELSADADAEEEAPAEADKE